MEKLCCATFVSVINILEALGLNTHALCQLMDWTGSGRSVTLRFKAEERCELEKLRTREQVFVCVRFKMLF
jgi:hypothetical protein